MYLVVQLFTIVAHGFMGEHCLVERTPWMNKVVFAVVGFVVSETPLRFLTWLHNKKCWSYRHK